MIGQLFRYALVGGAVTALQAAVYFSLASMAGMHPQIANFLGYLVAVASGYGLHGAITFRHGGKARARSLHQAGRFVAVSLLSLALNAFWVWLCIDRLGGATWSPIPMMALVTPAVVFALNRFWVFR